MEASVAQTKANLFRRGDASSAVRVVEWSSGAAVSSAMTLLSSFARRRQCWPWDANKCNIVYILLVYV